MKAIYNMQQFFHKLYAIAVALILANVTTGQQSGIWEKYEVKERMTNLQEQKARCLPNCSFSGKSDDMGMTIEFNYYSNVDHKNHVYRGHVAWEWKNQKGPGTLIPGEKVTIRGIISNLTSETSGVSGYATFGNWGFMKPESGKSGDETARPNGTAIMVGSFEVPKGPGKKPDGSINPYLNLTFTLSGGNEQSFIDRTIVYKWKPNQQPQPVSTIIQGTWATQANEYANNVGQRYTFYFPAGGTISSRVWGTDTYTYDCSIASAAVHAGLITAQNGGTVTIEIRSGQASYKGSLRNGVTSKDWGAFGGSFVFVDGNESQPVLTPTAIQGTWATQANEYANNVGQRYTFYFPAGGTISSRVWGTDTYTYDCSIASAAVHAGLITAQNGGTVTIEIRSGQASYKGSIRNGVTSKDWGAFGGSFIFIK